MIIVLHKSIVISTHIQQSSVSGGCFDYHITLKLMLNFYLQDAVTNLKQLHTACLDELLLKMLCMVLYIQLYFTNICGSTT